MPGGAPFGSHNARKSRLVEQALIREIKQRDLKDGDGETLRRIAAAQIEKALRGHVDGFDRVADRIEGKPTQAIEHSGPDGGPIETRNSLNVQFVSDPAAPDKV